MSSDFLPAEIPLGALGMTGSKNQSQVRPGQLITAREISFQLGTISKEGGAAKYNAAAISGAPSILGGRDWFPSPGVQRVVVYTSAGKLLKDSGDGSFPVTLATGLSTSVVPVFAEGGQETAAATRKLFVVNGLDSPRVLAGDGAAAAAIASPSADWAGTNQPVTVVGHEGRMWFAMGHRWYYSTTASHEDVAGGSSLPVYPGESERIIAGASYKGFLITLKYPKGVYIVDTSNVSPSSWRVSRLSPAPGGVSPMGIIIIDNDVLFLDAGGNVHLLSAVQEYGSVGSSSLSDAAQMGTFLRESLNLNALNLAQGVYYSAKREAHFLVAGAGSTKNTRRLVVDTGRSGTDFRFRFSERDTCISAWLRKDTGGVERLVIGDDAGFAWILDQAVRSKDGAGYASEFQTGHDDLAWLDASLATVRKNGFHLELVAEPLGNWNVFADIYWDGNLRETIPFNLGQQGAALGSFVLGTDALAGSGVLNKKHRVHGGGRRFGLGIRNSGAGEDYSLAKAILHFSPGDERGAG